MISATSSIQLSPNVLLWRNLLVVWNALMLRVKRVAQHLWISRVSSLASPIRFAVIIIFHWKSLKYFCRIIMAPLKQFSRTTLLDLLVVWFAQQVICAWVAVIWLQSKKVQLISEDYSSLRRKSSREWDWSKFWIQMWSHLRNQIAKLLCLEVDQRHCLALRSWRDWGIKILRFMRKTRILVDWALRKFLNIGCLLRFVSP